MTLLFMTCAVVLAIPTVALADTTIADGDGLAPLADNNMAFGPVCSGVESSKSAPVFINRNGSASTNVNNNVFANSSTATVTVTGVTGTGLSAQMGTPNTITLPSDWSDKANNTQSASVSSTVKLNSSVAGPGTGTVTYTATGTNAGGGTVTRTDTMNVSWTTANCDTTAPTSSATGTVPDGADAGTDPDPYTSGAWTNQDVTVALSGQDNQGGSGLKEIRYTLDGTTPTASSTLYTGSFTRASTTTVKFLAYDNAGNAGDVNTFQVNIDKVAPTVNPASVTSVTWRNSSLSQIFAASDSGSGLANAGDASFTLTASAESADADNPTVVSRTVYDLAGNSTTRTVSALIDLTDPTFSAELDKTAASTGWFNSSTGAPTVSFNCSDTLSGLAGLCPAASTFGNGADQSRSETIFDNAGNDSTAGVQDVDVDLNAPVITDAGRKTQPNAAGWYASEAFNKFTASDSLSGLADSTKASFEVGTGTQEGSGLTVASGSVSDNAGNTAASMTSTATYNVDLSNPSTPTFNGGPAADSSHYFGSVPAEPTCSSSDAVSGLKDCVVTGYGTGVGSHTMTATATDNAGRTATATRSYTVLAWTTKGFYSPVDMGGVVNTVKGGSTVPLKFELFSGTNELTDTSAITSLTATKTNCLAGSTEDAIEVTATGGTSLRYDSTGGQFIYNWKTPTGAGCYTVTMTAQDGSKITAYFKSLK